MTQTQKLLVVLAFAGFLVAGCGVSLAADVTPPPNYRPPTTASQPQKEIPVAYPLVPPDPVQGKLIYEQKCLPCHGPEGMGNGVQATNLPNGVIQIGKVEIARNTRPVDWFIKITQGNLQRFMPGFSGSLTDRQRWDVVAYLYTFSTTQEEVEVGKAIFQSKCVDCHGVEGKGNGPKAVSLANKPADWTDPAQLAKKSAQELWKTISSGSNSMPAYAAELSDAQRWALTAYIRSLTIPLTRVLDPQGKIVDTPVPTQAANAQSTPVAPVQTTPGAGKVRVKGNVTHAAGKPLPPDLTVQLLSYDGMATTVQATTTVSVGGNYAFPDQQLQQNWMYVTQVTVADVGFSSDILNPANLKNNEVVLPIVVYDTSTDPSVLLAERLHVFLDVSTSGSIQVMELFILSNPSDRVIISPGKNQPVITFDLPKGAVDLQFQDGSLGDRFVATPNGFGDLAPVLPGLSQQQVMFSYSLPYSGKLDLALPLPLPVDSAIVMIPPGSVKVQGSQLTDAGTRNMGGMTVQLYTASNLARGSKLAISLSGAARTPSQVITGIEFTPALGAGLAAFVLAIGGAVYYIFNKRKEAQNTVDDEGDHEEDEPSSEEEILDTIIALDDLYQAGNIPEEAYKSRRAALKQRLAVIEGIKKQP
ncbi:MAG TPA: c-type cytochrome [Anaerolineaceae bacterium]